MLTEDYLIRMINLAIAALLRLAKLRRDGQAQEAQALIDLTLEQLLGLRADLVKQLDDERLYYILTRNERLDTQRLELIAELFQNEAEMLLADGKTAEGTALSARALRYFLEACFTNAGEGMDTSALRVRIQQVAAGLDPRDLGADTLWPLSGYYEEQGDFTHAEALLLLMHQRANLRDSITPELIAFYERLYQKPADALSRGGMQPDELRAKLRTMRSA